MSKRVCILRVSHWVSVSAAESVQRDLQLFVGNLVALLSQRLWLALVPKLIF